MAPRKLLNHEVSYPVTVLMSSTRLRLVVVGRMYKVVGSCIGSWLLAHRQVSRLFPHFFSPRNFDIWEDCFHLHGIASCIVAGQLAHACANLQGPMENVDSLRWERHPVLVVLELLARVELADSIFWMKLS